MEQTRSKDGTVIGFRRSGEGPPLLLVHGATADLSRWSPILPLLEPDFSVYAMDRRGRGASGDAPDYALAREAEDVAAVVEAIGEPAFVLGHSHGALVSLEAALLTDGIARLVLYEPPLPPDWPPIPSVALDRMAALVDSGDWEAALEVMFRDVVKMPDHEFEAYRQLPVWKVRVSLAPTVVRELTGHRDYRFEPERLASLQVPTMVLLGGDSPPPVQEGMVLLDTALPNSQIVVLPGQQHIAMDTAPELFVREVRRFLLA
jgi:pimeloyl-ACP methyl ester carboxylesterase